MIDIQSASVPVEYIRTTRGSGLSRRWFALSAVALGTSYGLLPLYSSNQNHHFLIGLARAGEGLLADDWLSSTADPFPVFSAYITLVHRFLGDWVHYVVYYALFGAYAYGLMRIAEHVRPVAVDRLRATAERLSLLAALCVLHNEVIGYLAGIDLARLPWWQMMHWGVAEQEIFGHGAFQASSFGMLLPLAIAVGLDGRRAAAALLASSVLLIHFSYALTAAALVGAFMYLELEHSGGESRTSNPESRHPRRVTGALAVAGLALLPALPAATAVVMRLGPTSRDVSTAAASILVPHLPQETIIAHWFGWKATLQVLWMIVGLGLAAGTDLLPILAAPFAAGVALTLLQMASGSPQLALMFPWRVSVLIVPIATAVATRQIIAIVADGASERRVRAIRAVSIAAVAVSVLIGAVRMTLHFAYFYGDRRLTQITDRIVPERWRVDFARVLGSDALPMMHFVRATAQRGDLYVIPPELERFRTVSGAPALADLKSHPYKDVEVIEWRRRLDRTLEIYEGREGCAAVDRLAARYSVTHVVADRRLQMKMCNQWTRTYADAVFTVYRLGRTPDATLRFPAR